MTERVRDETGRVLNVYERFAHRYDRSVRFWERVLGLDEGRRWVAARARGEVLEIGIGTGRNLPYYPADAGITGVDLSSAMLDQARRRLRELGRDVDLKVGDAQALDLPDEAYDTVVVTLALCSVPDERRALSEAYRVLRPGGALLLLEHVRSPVAVVRAGQRVLEPLFLWLAADHLLRDPLDRLAAVGFVVEMVERSHWGIVERVAARKPLRGTVEAS
ncbi:MAG: class I SAM-dependent methyltransferase [Actinomycetota bacterium]